MRQILLALALLASAWSAPLTGNKITADGTYTVTTTPGKRYVFSASGTFGSGSLAVNWTDSAGISTAFANSPATAAETWTFTAPTSTVSLVLSGATNPSITVGVTLAGNSIDLDVSELSQSGATTGQVPTWNGTTWVAETITDRAIIFPGSYASDLAALRGGISLNSAYRKTDKSVVWRDAVTEQIALMGDSITAQGSAGTYSMTDAGYGSWARVFGAAQWDAALNGSVLEFATGGYTSAQVESTHLPEVLASNATRCVIACGVNDYAAGQTSAQTATRLRGMWSTLAAAGITPIATTITPDASNTSRQAWIAATNTLIRSHATTDSVLLCDFATQLETSPGVGSTTYQPDNIHPNSLGASKLGRALAAIIDSITGMDSRDNFANTSWLTANSSFAGSSGQPTSWSSPSIASGATLNSKSLVSSDYGNWWQLDYANGSATSRSTLANMAANTGTVIGKTVEGILELEVISGGLRGFQFRVVTTGGTQESYDLQTSDNIATADLITSADGTLVLRTPKTVVSSGVTLLWPQITFSGTSVFRIRRCGVREVP